ncbi:hypothetical protein BGZ97_005053 [Linnemannia gamsii]|uniref:Peptide hydrolase n=1 Tax=Linnemannia gamsii TaxID=64522 RepID=A0A9P6UGN7_9FUNG|nr:hypothetical protein BGZ97_005053 [Linnemannia gamsii]
MAATPSALKQRNQKAASTLPSSTTSSTVKENSKHGLTKAHSGFSPRKTILSAWATFLGFLFILGMINYQLHYTLPTPVQEATNPVTGEVQFSEESVRKVVRHLASDIGYRVVGTEQEVEAKEYLINELVQLKEQSLVAQHRWNGHNKAGSQDVSLSFPNFDMWVQVSDGSHRFDFMSKVVMKMYTNMTNIIVRLSCGPECDKNTILLNSHYDTTLGSPGAVDDGLGVGVMMEIIRVMSQRPSKMKNGIVFLFNGGEESLQDASHAFITQHELKDNVRAVVNLEACGTSGREILFQANSRAMIDAYATVPHPHGTVLANDLFATGLILSDTDYRQFTHHGNLTGLDMAVYKNSYLYHTHLDLDEYMEAGLPQHMGENALALATFLTEKAELTNLEATTSVVFFDVFGLFFVAYSWAAALKSHFIIGGLALLTMATSVSRPSVRGTISIFLSFLAAILLPNFSVILLKALGTPMQWFSHEWLSSLLFSPMSLAGMFGVQYLFHDSKASSGANELTAFSSLQLFFTIALASVSYVGLASSYVFALFTLSTTIALAINYRKVAQENKDGSEVLSVDFSTYFIASIVPSSYLAFVIFSVLDIFIPLTGRIGVDAPVDNIVAVLTGFLTFVFCPPMLAFSHRFGRAVLKRIVIGLLVIHLLIVLLSSATSSAYNEFHPKRVFVQHVRNMTSGESGLYIAHADPGPFYEPYVSKVETLFNEKSTFRSAEANPGDWSAIYPFNQFLESYVIDTTPYIKAQTKNQTISLSESPLTAYVQQTPRLTAERISYDPETGLRKLTILCTHPNYIWTVASFDTHLTSWSLTSSEPFAHHSHYVVRHVGTFASDGWSLELEYKATGPEDKLTVELTSMETEGFGKDEERELIGSGEIGVMRKVLKSAPSWVALTYFGATVDRFQL